MKTLLFNCVRRNQFFEIETYNPLPIMNSIESPITGVPTIPENPGW